MAANEIHVDDVGTKFNLTIKDDDGNIVDISTASNYDIIFRKPDGTILTKDAVFITDGSDGKIRYTTVAGDLDQYGKWSIQAFIDFGSTEWYTDVSPFTVYKNIGC